MGTTLFVYDIVGLKEMRNQKNNCTIVSIIKLINKYDSIDMLMHVEESDIDDHIFDITNFIASYNNRFFPERYLLYLKDEQNNINFCINESYYSYFKDAYPHIFSEEEINYDFVSFKKHNLDDLLQIEETSFSLTLPISLYSYESIDELRNIRRENSIITLTSLVQDDYNILYKDAIEQLHQNIKSNKISYIDLSTSISLLKNKDNVLLFEKVIYKLNYLRNVRFLVDTALKERVIELFPVYFEEMHSSPGNKIQEEVVKSKELKYQHIDTFMKEVDSNLLGHKEFKKDFRFNLHKFSILNSLDERKILSVFICGKSGVGKTEFAKILSETMYPNESLIKINFGNYSTEGVLNSLIGSPLGYVGSEEGGELVNKINTSESKVILIDEFEKADPSVYNFFYELLEDGKFTDRQGKEHCLNGYIIIFTSNINKERYVNFIPDSLKSRFDMIYEFDEIDNLEIKSFINRTANRLISCLNDKYECNICINDIEERLIKLSSGTNMRSVKRKVENIVLQKFLEQKYK